MTTIANHRNPDGHRGDQPGTPAVTPASPTATYQPVFDILQQGDTLTLHADMPGSDAESIDVKLDRGLLTVRGRVAPRRPAAARTLLQEYGVGDYFASFQVGEHFDPERVRAEYTDGVLSVRLPKRESAKPRRIPVAVGSTQPAESAADPA